MYFRGFSKDFEPCVDQIVQATLKIYKAAIQNLLPTPAKSHYLFNLRDFSRVIQGVLLSTPETMEEPASMQRCVLYVGIEVLKQLSSHNLSFVIPP